MMKICTACWQGNYVDGVCNKCHRKEEADLNRREDALPLMSVLQNRYSIGAVLGKGGFGITYSAWDNVQHKKVALKELFPNAGVSRSAGDSQVVVKAGYAEHFSGMKMRFREEAQLLRLIDKRCNVIQVYDLFDCNNTVYYTMEYLEGCDLNVYRKQHGLLPWDFLQPILKSILQTLEVLHKQNLIHRDISPDNIFLLDDNSERLIDFGSARTYQGNLNLTVLKKDGFAPWEQTVHGGKQGPWTDIYSLSATIYLLLSGKLPPRAEKRINGEQQLIPLKQLCPDIPNTISLAIEKGMSIKISDRFQSASEFMVALGIPADNLSAENYGVSIEQKRPLSKAHIFWLYGRGGLYAGKRKKLTVDHETVLGRKSTNDISFPESTVGVSRQQCVVLVNRSGEMFVRDAGSSYGTYLNNRRIGLEWVRVYPGNQIQFGLEVFELVHYEQ